MRLKELREAKGLSQRKLANELGLTPGSRASLAINMPDDNEGDDDDEFD